jgi:hypothetical protein
MKRDIQGIIIQTSGEDPNYEDGGDSSFSTGIAGFSGSKKDRDIMSFFIKDGKLVRHPFQQQWNDSSKTSRDQVIAFYSGIHKRIDVSYELTNSCLKYANSWKVNKDILMPSHKLYLFKCAGATAPLWIYPLAYINQFFALIWDCFVTPNEEKNQAICMNIVFGKHWIRALLFFHPSLYRNVSDYFGGWRDKECLGLIFTTKILKETK